MNDWLVRVIYFHSEIKPSKILVIEQLNFSYDLLILVFINEEIIRLH